MLHAGVILIFFSVSLAGALPEGSSIADLAPEAPEGEAPSLFLKGLIAVSPSTSRTTCVDLRYED
jgi:hypothetical protein